MSNGFRLTLPVVLLFGGGFLLLVTLWGRTIGKADAADQWQHEANVALFGPAHRTIVKQQERLKAAQKTHTVYMTRWREIADTATVDSVKIEALTNAANECQVALLACSERALIAEARVAELEPLLTKGLKIVDCHMLGVGFLPRCPSRTVAFFGGAILGAGAALIVR